MLVGKIFGRILKEKNTLIIKRYLFSIFKCSIIQNVFDYKKKTVSLIKCHNRQGDCALMVLVRLE